MTNKTRTHASEKNAAAVRQPLPAARASRRLPEQVHPAVAFRRAMAGSLSPADIFALQRTAGNRAVEQILAERAQRDQHTRLTVQAKLAVGAADDTYEREADRIAAEVVQTSEPFVPNIQRQASQEEDEEETIQTKPIASSVTPLVQRQEMPEKEDEEDEEETLVQRSGVDAPASVGPGVERGIASARSGGQSLPEGLRTRMEHAFGADFSRVRVHTDSESDSLNRSLRSRAFTTGQDLFFKSGEYKPESRRGQELIAHELTHVIQQNGGAAGNRGVFVQRGGHDSIYGSIPGEEEEARPRSDAREQIREEEEEEERAPSSLADRISKGLEDDRMTWKMMSKYEKAAVAVAAPAVMPFIDWVTSSYDAGKTAYKYLAGKKPGWPREVGSAVAGIITGAVVFASGLGILKGLLRGIALGIGNPLYSIKKRVAKLSFEEDIQGIYRRERPHERFRDVIDEGRQENYNYLSNNELINYALLGVGGLAAVGSVATRTGVDVAEQGWEGFYSTKVPFYQ